MERPTSGRPSRPRGACCARTRTARSRWKDSVAIRLRRKQDAGCWVLSMYARAKPRRPYRRDRYRAFNGIVTYTRKDIAYILKLGSSTGTSATALPATPTARLGPRPSTRATRRAVVRHARAVFKSRRRQSYPQRVCGRRSPPGPPRRPEVSLICLREGGPVSLPARASATPSDDDRQSPGARDWRKADDLRTCSRPRRGGRIPRPRPTRRPPDATATEVATVPCSTSSEVRRTNITFDTDEARPSPRDRALRA